MTAFTVIAELDELLKPLRFTRKKMVWNRLVGRVVDVVDIQISKAGDTITVNTGVLDRDVHAKLWNEQPPSFVQEPSCTVRARVGELINGHDRWWPLNKTEPALQVSRGCACARPPIPRANASARGDGGVASDNAGCPEEISSADP